MVKSTKDILKETVRDQLQQGSLVTRITSISLPEDVTEFDPAMYYNGQLIAVEGLDLKNGETPKRHFCILMNQPKNMNSPSILKHQVMELMFSNLDENKIPENRELTKWTPLAGNVQGYAFIMESSAKAPSVPKVSTPSLDVTDEKPELNPYDAVLLGSSKGGVVVSSKGDTHIISSDGSEVKFGEELDLGPKEIKATSGQGDNWLYIWNPLANGKTLPLPELLPMFVGIRILPNIPGIVDMYKKVDYFKKMFDGIQNLIEANFTNG